MSGMTEWERQENKIDALRAENAQLAAALRRQVEKCNSWQSVFESIPQECMDSTAHDALSAVYSLTNDGDAQDAADAILAMTRRDIPTLDMEQFRKDRWAAGRAARGLAADAPFQGDPFVELVEELADALNYCSEARQQVKTGFAIGQLACAESALRAAWMHLSAAVQEEVSR